MIAIPKRARADWLVLADALATFRPACQFDDEDGWYEPPTGATREQAAAHREEIAEICGRCPLAVLCRAYASAAKETHGCWGGQWMDEKTKQARRESYRATKRRKTA